MFKSGRKIRGLEVNATHRSLIFPKTPKGFLLEDAFGAPIFLGCHSDNDSKIAFGLFSAILKSTFSGRVR